MLANHLLRATAASVAVLMVIGLIALMAWGLSHKTSVTSLSGFTRIQQPAPEFRLSLLPGGELYLSELRGRPIVINFWASWCSPCREEALSLERAWQIYRDEGVVFIGIDIQDTEESARAYLREFGVTYPNGRDVDGKITIDYGIVGMPATFFVNRIGIVERRWVGAIDEDRLLAWVNELVSDVTPSGETDGINSQAFFELDQDG